MHNLHRFVLERSIRCNTTFVLFEQKGLQWTSKTPKRQNPKCGCEYQQRLFSKVRIRPGWAYAQFNDCNITKRAFSHPNSSNTFSQTRSIAGIRKHSQSDSSSTKCIFNLLITPDPAVIFSSILLSTLYHSPLTTFHSSPVPNDTMEPVKHQPLLGKEALHNLIQTKILPHGPTIFTRRVRVKKSKRQRQCS